MSGTVGFVTAALVGGTALATGCVRDAADERCPAAAVGELVITELRGPQTGGDTRGQWIEIANVGAGEIDLEGSVVELLSLSGGQRDRVIVRRSVPVAAGDLVVLGRFADNARPAWIDYGMASDLAGSLPTAGSITLFGCDDVALDRVAYDGLPEQGTRSLGLDPPTAAGNDDGAAWCANTTPSTDTTQLGVPGTPGESNPPCAVP